MASMFPYVMSFSCGHTSPFASHVLRDESKDKEIPHPLPCRECDPDHIARPSDEGISTFRAHFSSLTSRADTIFPGDFDSDDDDVVPEDRRIEASSASGKTDKEASASEKK